MVTKLLGQRKNKKRRINYENYSQNIYTDNGDHQQQTNELLNSSNEMENYEDYNDQLKEENIENDDIFSESNELLELADENNENTSVMDIANNSLLNTTPTRRSLKGMSVPGGSSMGPGSSKDFLPKK